MEKRLAILSSADCHVQVADVLKLQPRSKNMTHNAVGEIQKG